MLRTEVVVVNRLGLHAPFVAAAGLSAVEGPPTFPTRGATDHIDWIAVGGLTASAVEVPSIWASDHFPLVATLH